LKLGLYGFDAQACTVMLSGPPRRSGVDQSAAGFQGSEPTTLAISSSRRRRASRPSRDEMIRGPDLQQ
jgi:hypothetical protein